MTASLCFAAAAIALGHALQIASGFYDSVAIAWLTAALLLTVIGTCLVGPEPARSVILERAIEISIGLGIAWQLLACFTTPPGWYLHTADLRLFKTGIVAEALCVAVAVLRIRRLERLWIPALLALSFALGVWMLRASPSPDIDVVTIHHRAMRALLHGHSPYGLTFANIYADTSFYNPALVRGGVVMFGYPYPPLSLLAAVPAHLITGDYRYAELAAIVASAGFISVVSRGAIPKLAAALLLTTPRIFFVLEQGWTEPIALVLLAVTAFALARRPSWVPWAVGLLIVTKQYLVVAVPLILRVGWNDPRGKRRFFASAACAACMVTLPFVFWRFRPFLNDVVFLQFHEPLRTDSLSYVSWAARTGWATGSIVWSIVAAAVALAVGLARTPNTATGFLASFALAMFTMFAFGSKAFCNYYFFIIGALCCVVAALGGGYAGDAAAGRIAPARRAPIQESA